MPLARVTPEGPVQGPVAIILGVTALVAVAIYYLTFAKIFAEPLVSKAVDYEHGRDAVLTALNRAAHRTAAPAETEIFSRDIQSTIGVASGIIAFSVAMGALVAGAYLVLHGRFTLRPSRLAWLIAGLGFLGVYLLPFVKYPANPPAIGHSFTVTTRGQLYLALVGCSRVLLGLAAYWYSVINQLLVRTTIALAFGALLDRFILGGAPRAGPGRGSAPEPNEQVPSAAGQP